MVLFDFGVGRHASLDSSPITLCHKSLTPSPAAWSVTYFMDNSLQLYRSAVLDNVDIILCRSVDVRATWIGLVLRVTLA